MAEQKAASTAELKVASMAALMAATKGGHLAD